MLPGLKHLSSANYLKRETQTSPQGIIKGPKGTEHLELSTEHPELSAEHLELSTEHPELNSSPSVI